jgi:ADP-ribose pyrophosphatase YjhB (NUDIX family)
MKQIEHPELPKRHAMPFVRLELAVMTILDGVLSVLLIKRQQAPHAGKWALPGGVLRIDLDSNLESAAQRVGQERLGVSLPYLRQQCAVGGVRRDPRAPWALSLVYRALVPADAFEPRPGKRVDQLKWVPVMKASVDPELAFDHASLISHAWVALQSEIERLELPGGFLPIEFTLGELQSTCESLLGRKLDKSSFRRRLEERDAVKPVKNLMRTGGAHRPAQVYRLAD